MAFLNDIKIPESKFNAVIVCFCDLDLCALTLKNHI